MMRVALLSVAAFAAALLLAPAPIARAQSTAVIEGGIYWDVNGNGHRDAAEPSLIGSPRLVDPRTGVEAAVTGTDEAGRYSFTIAPGTYGLDDGVSRVYGICRDGIFTYNPFPYSNCISARFPIASPVVGAPFEVLRGGHVTHDVGIRTKNQMLIVARAIDELAFVREGAKITAWVSGKQCGSALVPSAGENSGENNISIYVDGRGETPGCARPGDEIELRLGDKVAHQKFVYGRFSPVRDAYDNHEGLEFSDIVFMDDYAWYWGDYISQPFGISIPPGTRVTAFVDGFPCGETVIAEPPGTVPPPDGVIAPPLGFPSGFPRLLVPSARIKPGCGTPGSQFTLYIGGQFFLGAPWQTGITGIQGSLQAPVPSEATPMPTPSREGTPAPEVTPVIKPPAAGNGGYKGEGWSGWVVFAVLMTGAAATIAIEVKRRRNTGVAPEARHPND